MKQAGDQITYLAHNGLIMFKRISVWDIRRVSVPCLLCVY